MHINFSKIKQRYIYSVEYKNNKSKIKKPMGKKKNVNSSTIIILVSVVRAWSW